ncbi:MAG: hypothetical protein ACKOS8_17910, partial [Gemmataceae bacterium]
MRNGLITAVAGWWLACLAPAVSAQDWAKAALEKSPRHGEWVELKHGDRKLKAFVVFPEVSKKATAAGQPARDRPWDSQPAWGRSPLHAQTQD